MKSQLPEQPCPLPNLFSYGSLTPHSPRCQWPWHWPGFSLWARCRWFWVCGLSILFKACPLPPRKPAFQRGVIRALLGTCPLSSSYVALLQEGRGHTIFICCQHRLRLRVFVKWTSHGVEMSLQCSGVGVLPAPLRESGFPQVAQAGESEGSGVPCGSFLLLPGINTHWGLDPTAHTLTLPSLLSCDCHTSSLSVLFNSLSISGSLGDFWYLLLCFRGKV